LALCGRKAALFLAIHDIQQDCDRQNSFFQDISGPGRAICYLLQCLF
jgi:hypothetical protein